MADELRERLGDERLRVRQVGEVVAQRERGERVDRLGDQDAAVAELRARELEEANERGRRKVLDDLAREDRAEASVRLRLEVREQVRLLDVEPFAARVGDHVAVGVDPARLDPGVAEQRDELAAAAADVEHRRVVAQVVDVRTLALAHELGRAAHAALEGEVVGERRRRRLRRDRLRAEPAGRRSSRRTRSSSSAIRRPRVSRSAEMRSSSSKSASISLSVASLKLRCCCASGSTYQRIALRSARFRNCTGAAAVRRALGGHGPELLGRGPRAGTRTQLGAVRPPAELVAESFEQGLDVDLLRGWSGHCGKCKEGGLRRC